MAGPWACLFVFGAGKRGEKVKNAPVKVRFKPKHSARYFCVQTDA
jgi:hypothetical protein